MSGWDEAVHRWLLSRFPRVWVRGYLITSRDSDRYNCIAWAAGETHQWWWPDRYGEAYWPPDCRRKPDVQAFMTAFSRLGYVQCLDGNPEDGVEKVAIFADSKNAPTHMARQLDCGIWTSKLGDGWDISHGDVRSLEGERYGTVVAFLARPKKAAP